MSTSQKTAPTLPRTLELDHHARQFFDLSEWSGPVQARFKLAHPALADKVFIGRAARFRTGAIHLVAQEFSSNPEVDGPAPCLISALPFATTELEDRDDYLRRYFARHQVFPSPESRCSPNWRERVPTLRGAVANTGLRHLHFDAGTGLGFIFAEDGCGVLNLGCERRWKGATRPKIHLGGALFNSKPPRNPVEAFVEMDNESFHTRVEELLQDDSCALYHSVAFYRMGLRERCRHVFGCEGRAQIRVREVLGLALMIEMGAGGTLENWASAKWHPWAEEKVLEGMDESGASVHRDVPERLGKWLEIIETKTGCQVNEDIRFDDAGLHTFARKWAGEYLVSAQRPSAHEEMEALMKLKETLNEG